MQGFVSHGIVVVNNVVMKICEVLPSGIGTLISLHLNKTLPDLAALVGHFRIFDVARHFHFSLFCILSQLRCFAVVMKTTHGPNSDIICSSPNLNSCRANDE